MFLPFWMIPIQPYPDPKLLSSRVPTVLEPSQHPATSIGGALSGCVATDAAECPPPSPAEPWSWARAKLAEPKRLADNKPAHATTTSVFATFIVNSPLIDAYNAASIERNN